MSYAELAVTTNVWPSTATGIPFRGEQVNGRDGFSPATPFVVYFKRGVDATADESRLVVTVVDHGVGIGGEPDARRLHLGRSIMAALCDAVEVGSDPDCDGTRVVHVNTGKQWAGLCPTSGGGRRRSRTARRPHPRICPTGLL